MTVDHLKNIADKVPRGRPLLGIDVGKKTLGLAISDGQHGVATPIDTIKRTKFSKDIRILENYVREYDAGGFVLGLPVHMDGSEGPRCQSVRDFALELQKQLDDALRVDGKVWIALWDERLSTASVEDIVDEHVEKRKTRINAKKDGLIDKLAAMIILQGALDYLNR